MDTNNRRQNRAYPPVAWYPAKNAAFYSVFRPTVLIPPPQIPAPNDESSEECTSTPESPRRTKDDKLYAGNTARSAKKSKRKKRRVESSKPQDDDPVKRKLTVFYIVIAILSAIILVGAIVIPIVVTQIIKNIQSAQPVCSTTSSTPTAAAIQGSFRATSLIYSNELSNPNSTLFQQYQQLICDNLQQIANQSQISPNYKGCSVNRFTNGSVIVDFGVKLESPTKEGVDNLVSTAVKIFTQSLTNHTSNSRLDIDPSSVIIEPVVVPSDFGTTVLSYQGVTTNPPNAAAATTGNSGTSLKSQTSATVIPPGTTNLPNTDATPAGNGATTLKSQSGATGASTNLPISAAVTARNTATSLNGQTTATAPRQGVTTNLLISAATTAGNSPTSLQSQAGTAAATSKVPNTATTGNPGTSQRSQSGTAGFPTTPHGWTTLEATSVFLSGSTTPGSGSGCGNDYTLLTSAQGTISSPNYPDNYPPNATCIYIISLQSAATITFVFSPPFHLEECCDFLYILDICATQLHNFTGSTLPPSLTIYSCNQVGVGLFTNGDIQYSGFNLTYSSTEPAPCAGDNFTCTENGHCILPCSKCDRICDCPSCGDEANCHAVCGANQFACRYVQQCIPNCKVCDSVIDCDDGSDENNCTSACLPPRFQCHNPYYYVSRCLQSCSVCDGVNDCGDWSDEYNCTCSSNQFRCANGQCVLKYARCNGYTQCSDGSDELDCPCPFPDDFVCKSGDCIRGSWRCDGKPDCGDGSDERNCSHECPYKQFQCASNGWCLLTKSQCYVGYWRYDVCSNDTFVCDGYKDCIDGSDERNCPNITQGSYMTSTVSPSNNGDNCSAAIGGYQCASGECLQVLYEPFFWYGGCNPSNNFCQKTCVWNFHCDGYRDCLDGSDERNCTAISSQHDNSTCLPGQFRCHNSYCISCQYVCNGYSECDDNSDELDCTCLSDQFQCTNGRCIPSYYKCDGYPHCSDGSDETNCTCSYYQFRCANGQCIYAPSQCDGYRDCNDGSDELNCTCSYYQFRCANGQCIYASNQCDGYRDCNDGSDELNCSCAANQFQCSHYYCLSSCKRCDGVFDCPYDSSDEDNCTCDNSTHYVCPLSGACIAKCKLCDGSHDCFRYIQTYPFYIYDYGDEANCSGYCTADQFQCHDTYYHQCIPGCQRCDGKFQCFDSSDEVNCSCAFNDFHCNTNGQCVSNSSRCNGRLDCIDGSDEYGCGCESYQFECDNGQCVWRYGVCDRYKDCADGSDEQGCDNCTRYEFHCMGSKTCLNISKWCDNTTDCNDSSDESVYNCGGGYYYGFTCPNGFSPCSYYSNQGCYPSDGYCDGIIDCANGYDESYCYCPSETRFRCYNGLCLDKSKYCDGKTDCLDGSDEPQQCSRRCGPDAIECHNGRCVSNNLVCDGVNNCGDYTDETTCYCSLYYQFNCSNGLCLAVDKWCDGVVDCPDGGDEAPNCDKRCSPVMFTCNNSRCISKYQQCDGQNDCGDNSDEMGCDCGSYEYSCDMGVCVAFSTWCDGYRDCPDGSDEPHGCQAKCQSGQLRCNVTGACISQYQICDHIRDCPDNSDEIDCPCLSYQYRCNNGNCIYREWLCDGVKDCPLGDDETPSNCDHCDPTTQFRCSSDYVCISIGLLCDGVANCDDSSDEVNCLTINATGSNIGNTSAVVRATNHGVSDFYICASQWSFEWSDLACKLMGFQSVLFAGNASVAGTKFLGATGPASTVANATLAMAHLNITSCPSNTAVTLTCQHMECGVRSVPPDSVGPYIVNGDVAARGAWPWQIQLYIDGQFQCGGSIINEWWILTAGHCVEGVYSASEFIVKLGSNTLNGDDCQSYSVAQVFQNPLYDSFYISHDNALLLLQTPIQFSDTARPICMPSPSIDLRQFRVCVATGFGRHRYAYQSPASPILLQAKMNLMSYDACFANALNVTGPNGIGDFTSLLDYRVMICAGSFPTENDINACKGDSGGPLACQDQHGIWTQIGVVSWGFYDTQYIYCQNSVFARLPALIDWVQNTMAAHSNF